MAEKKNRGKWIFIISVVLSLALMSLIISGILGLVAGGSDDRFVRDGKGNTALLRINGVLLTETSPSLFGGQAETSASTLVRELDRINRDATIQAVIFEVNSPGGTPVASEEIAHAIKNLDKPTVVYIRDIGASGGYWVASASDHILASRLSFVGSIGVIGSYLEFSGLMDRYNVTYQRFVGGDYKDFGSPFRMPEEGASELFQQQIDVVYDIFVDEIAQNRNMSRDDVLSLANGMVFTGSQALELGLIDGIGGRREAVEYLEQTYNMTVNVVEYKRRVTLFDIFMMAQLNRAYSIGQGIGDSLVRSSTERRIMV